MGNTSSSSRVQATPSPNAQSPSNPPPSACPVEPSARAAWLQAAQDPQPVPSITTTTTTTTPPPPARLTKPHPLASDRVTSSIPRADLTPQTPTSPPSTTGPSNWIYPSEKMFFDAMRRKNHNPSPADMATVVPIHNAVNERAWAEIKTWEQRFAARQNEGCQGPRLRSFSGDGGKGLSPRARWLGLWGYERPFDRHDWVVERCGGGGVEYVIDFYRGRGGGLSFYLDVRPKLNSWEGWRMRLGRLAGL